MGAQFNPEICKTFYVIEKGIVTQIKHFHTLFSISLNK